MAQRKAAVSTTEERFFNYNFNVGTVPNHRAVMLGRAKRRKVNANSRILTTLSLSVLLVVACSSQQVVAPSHSDAIPSSWHIPNRFAPCGGQNGVRVRPCPVKLTSPSQKVIVAISGPRVVSGSYLGSCYDVCSITLVHQSKPSKWSIVPGASCGRAGLDFQGLTRRYIVVGNAALTIINKSC